MTKSKKPKGDCAHCDQARVLNPLMDERMVCNKCIKLFTSFQSLWKQGIKLGKKTKPEVADKIQDDLHHLYGFIKDYEYKERIRYDDVTKDHVAGFTITTSMNQKLGRFTYYEDVWERLEKLNLDMVKNDLTLVRRLAEKQRKRLSVAEEMYQELGGNPNHDREESLAKLKLRPPIKNTGDVVELKLYLDKWLPFGEFERNNPRPTRQQLDLCKRLNVKVGPKMSRSKLAAWLDKAKLSEKYRAKFERIAQEDIVAQKEADLDYKNDLVDSYGEDLVNEFFKWEKISESTRPYVMIYKSGAKRKIEIVEVEFANIVDAKKPYVELELLLPKTIREPDCEPYLEWEKEKDLRAAKILFIEELKKTPANLDDLGIYEGVLAQYAKKQAEIMNG